MNNFQRLKTVLLSVIILVTLVLSTPALATWSIIGVDRATGEIGIAGASCTFDVSGIASLIPGKGAIVVQAGSNYFARMKGVEQMNNNASVDNILNAMKDEQFSPERQQYGVIILDDNTLPLVYSGNEIKEWRGSKVGGDFAVLGNILVGEEVINAAFKAFDNGRDESFAERLMNALKAGELIGGDKRCGEQKARSAFISLYNAQTDAITSLSVLGIDKGGKPAVTLLKNNFDKLY